MSVGYCSTEATTHRRQPKIEVKCLNRQLIAPLLLVLLHQCTFSSAFSQQHVTCRRRLSPLFARGRNSKAPPKMPNIPAFSSESSRAGDAPTTSTMVVLDVENIRGANAFRISHESLLTRIRLWREERLSKGRQSSLEPMIWVSDHGMFPSVHHFTSSPTDGGLNYNGVTVKMPNNFGMTFAGLRTADDVIVDLVQLRCGDASVHPDDMSRNTTIVITADAKLISRCQIARRESSSLSDVIFVEPASLLQQLEVFKLNTHEEEGLFGESYQRSRSVHRAIVGDEGKRIDGKTNTMTSFKDSSIAMQQHARFQARFQNRGESNTTSPTNGLNNAEETADSSDTDGEETIEEEGKSDYTAAMAAKLKTEQIRRQMLLSDAFYLARPSKMRGRKSASTMAAIHAKYKDRNISKAQQNRLYKRRFGRQRNEEMAKAATTRKELATKLQLHIEGLAESSDEEDSDAKSARGESDYLLQTLLRWFEEEREADRADVNSPYDDLDGLPMHVSSCQDEAGNLESDGSWNPLGSVVRAPLRDSSEETKLAPLRLVVISDTHGFEGALSKFDENNQHGSHYLLPQADLLIHCGDFAASGSRKNQRTAARRLDEWLARQTHIPEKLVIKGNHDPDSPPRIIFPRSKALYVRSSSMLTVNGVTFALEPYARRMSLRSIRKQLSPAESPLPFCDVLVTHEPPKGILDLTYHGFTAGSSFLRNLVDNAKDKPRLWLCGHIHEGRGILTKTFSAKAEVEHDDSMSTIVINAANANSGKANRLVSGAVVIDVERSHVDELQTARSTIQLRQTEEDEVDAENMAGMENMTEYVVRPGVRRRKGIPRRQLLK